eukprot:scaffold127622_cov30-Tisochrysis_lutea.AAC.5
MSRSVSTELSRTCGESAPSVHAVEQCRQPQCAKGSRAKQPYARGRSPSGVASTSKSLSMTFS